MDFPDCAEADLGIVQTKEVQDEDQNQEDGRLPELRQVVEGVIELCVSL